MSVPAFVSAFVWVGEPAPALLDTTVVTVGEGAASEVCGEEADCALDEEESVLVDWGDAGGGDVVVVAPESELGCCD